MGFIIDIISAVKDVSSLLPKAEKKIINELLNDLSSHRVLYTPYELEYPSKVYHSLERIRQKLSTALEQLQPGSAIQTDLVGLQKVCSMFQTETEDISNRLFLYVEQIKSKKIAFENGEQGAYSVKDHDRYIIARFEYVGKADLIANDRINVMDIYPEATKWVYIRAFTIFQRAFGERLMFLSARCNAVLPDIFKSIIPIEEYIREQ